MSGRVTAGGRWTVEKKLQFSAWSLQDRQEMRLDSSLKSYDFFKKFISNEAEEFWLAALDPRLRIIDKKLLFRGTVDSCLIHPRDIIRYLCAQNASSFVIAHNHPSGDPRPSRQDVEATKKIYYLTQLMEIPMNDHVILGDQTFFSFADCGLILKFRALKSLRLRP